MKIIMVSPSGNLYGSEQVFLEYVKKTKLNKKIYVPSNSLLSMELSKHHISHSTFNNLYILYLSIFFKMLFFNYFLYVNEGGHIRYIKLIAKILIRHKFFVHLRILEDCNKDRLGKLTNNIKFITVSEYLKEKLDVIYKTYFIYDPYTISNFNTDIVIDKRENINIGIVGRVTETKGLDLLIPILRRIDVKNKISVTFYGNINKEEKWVNNYINTLYEIKNIKINFAGFVNNQKLIYDNIDILIHLNKIEALGRILFESIDYNTPYIAFNKGGCGELSKQLELDELLVEDNEDWVEDFIIKINNINTQKKNINKSIVKAKDIILDKFNSKIYSDKLDKLLSDKIK